jgi:hypothetical protein
VIQHRSQKQLHEARRQYRSSPGYSKSGLLDSLAIENILFFLHDTLFARDVATEGSPSNSMISLALGGEKSGV